MDIEKSNRPREKLKRLGVRHLTDRELIQIIIGSGTKSFRVGRIAKKVLMLIQTHEPTLTYEALVGIPGVGVAKASQLIALFELAARYPVRRLSERVDSIESVMRIVGYADYPSLVVITLDGAGCVLNKHSMRLTLEMAPTVCARQTIRCTCVDNAESVIVIMHTRDATIRSTMHALQLAREIRHVGRIVGVRLQDMIVGDGRKYKSVLDGHDE